MPFGVWEVRVCGFEESGGAEGVGERINTREGDVIQFLKMLLIITLAVDI